jgi:2-keto-4-pentenoate hydratase/2-oxohepta-3-ene-1,7-dioic acid hydratase in catechol pathway
MAGPGNHAEGSAASGESLMTSNRRVFLAGGFAGVAAATATSATAQPGAAFEMPRGMTLLTFQREGRFQLGVRMPQGVLDVSTAAAATGLAAPSDMDDLLQNGKGGLLRMLVEAAPAGAYLQEETLTFGPVVARPEKIILIGHNYKRHVEEVKAQVGTDPVLFNKYNNTLNAHGGQIRLPAKVATEFDYETELVIVFGRETRNVSEAEALDHVAGYCVGNDFSARDLQRLTSQAMIGKTCDGFAPLGPYLVTSDLIGDPHDLRLQTWVNGEARQDWTTGDMIFNCRQLISFASKMMTIRPGDLLFTGTPQGVIQGMPREQRVWLRPGDVVTSSIAKLGILRFELT